jgi:tetratricopeptide (TPR) repeat protein
VTRIGALIACWCVVLGGLAGCLGASGTEPADPRRATLMETGVEMFRRGNYAQAAGQFEEALDRARLTGSHAAAYDAAYQAAASYVRLRQWEDVQRMVDAANVALDASGRSGSASLALVRGHLLREIGQPGQALRVAEAALADRPEATARGLLHLLEAEARADLQEVAAARRSLASAVDAWPGARRAPSYANVRGRVALLQGRPVEAARAFEREADRAAKSLDVATVAEALAHAGAARAQAQQWRKAAEHWLAAAGSARQQPALANRAQRWLEEARTAARRAQATDLLNQIQRVQSGDAR